MEERKRLKSIEQEGWTTLAMMIITADAMERKTDVKPMLDERVKNGWRDWRLAVSKLDRINEALLDTIPIKQLQQIRANCEQNTLKFTRRYSATPLPPDMWCMKREDLAVLAEKAISTECAVCFREDSWNCPLRRVIKELPMELTTEGAIFCRCLPAGKEED